MFLVHSFRGVSILVLKFAFFKFDNFQKKNSTKSRGIFFLNACTFKIFVLNGHYGVLLDACRRFFLTFFFSFSSAGKWTLT